jgi:hypothetical protein
MACGIQLEPPIFAQTHRLYPFSTPVSSANIQRMAPNSSSTSPSGILPRHLKSSQILLRYQNVQLNEEDIGTYSARRLIIKIGGREIVLDPIGTLLIGTKGRVDVTGPAGSTRIMLVDKDAARPRFRVTAQINPKRPPVPEPPDKPVDWTWKLVTSPPTVRYIDLTQDSLFGALLEVGGG